MLGLRLLFKNRGSCSKSCSSPWLWPLPTCCMVSSNLCVFMSSYSSAYQLPTHIWSLNLLLSVSLHFHLPRARKQILGFCTDFCFMKSGKLLGKIWERSVYGFGSAPDVASYHRWLCRMSYVLWSWFEDNPVSCWGTVSSGATIQYT